MNTPPGRSTGERRRGRRLRAALTAGCLTLAPATTHAQDAPPPAPEPAPADPTDPTDPHEGRLLREVRLLRPVPGAAEGLGPVSTRAEQFGRNQIRSEPGRPYRRQTVVEDVGRLSRIGRFRTVDSLIEPRADGTLILTFVVEEQAIVEDVQCVGNRLLTDQQLLAEADILIGTPVDPAQIERAARRIEDLYRDEGYSLARVNADADALEDTGVLILRVREGDRVKVTDIRFEGNTAFTPRELKTAIRSRVAFPILETGPLDNDALAEDAASIVAFYRDRGYLDARADRRVQLSPDNREAIVTFLVEEGPVYTLRGVRVRYTDRTTVERYMLDVLNDPGAKLRHVTPEQARLVGAGVYDEAQVAGLMEVKPGDVYGVRKIEQSVRAIAEAYGRMGYKDARVELRRELRELERPEVDIILFVVEGKPFKTGEIIIQGNEITRNAVIARQVQVRPGRPLDMTAIEDTRLRLQQTRLFDPQPGKITVTPQPPVDGHSDVLIEVAETNTGSINFGVGVNSDAGVIGTLSLRQQNFDLFNIPTSWDEVFGGGAFRGAGQSFDITLQPGDRSQEYSVGLTEPYFLESDYSLSGRAFYQSRIFEDYDVQKFGGRFELARRFGSRLRAGITFRNEWAQLTDIDADAPVDFFDVEDRRLISGLGLALSRSTTDRPIVPSRGTRLSGSVEQVGILDNEVTFTRFSADYSAYFTLNESFEGLRTILALNLKADWIPQDPDDVPTYERFSLGGRTLRGLDFRTVSPRSVQQNGLPSDDPVGGLFSFFAGAEVQVPLHEVVGLALFVDTGTVLNDPGFDDYRVTAGLGLRLSVPALTQIPLAFDFGFPLLKADQDDELLFTFSLDIPY
ncbi:MAG: outer membrane protein assembly factor [Phycisphaerales bacterium]